MDEKITEWLNEYIKAAVLHGQATMQGKSEIANEQYDILDRMYERLKQVGPVGREALLSLTNHPDASVRCWAATHSLPYNESQAKGVLKELQEKEGSIVGFNAKMVLREWQKGNLNYD